MFAWRRLGAAMMLAACVAGCSEFRNRGGLVDQIEDFILFKADTKTHRVLRAYVLVASLIAVARQSGVAPADQGNLASRMYDAHEAVYDAFVCAYQSTNGCVFFDEKMALLDYSIYKLALLVLFDAESQEFFTQVRDRLIGDVPVLGPALRGTTKIVQAADDAATAAKQTTHFVEGLLTLSFKALERGVAGRLTALYRDAIEMDMVVVVEALSRKCAKEAQPIPIGHQTIGELYWYQDPPPNEVCIKAKEGRDLYLDGRGNLRAWQHYLRNLNGMLLFVDPTYAHFRDVSKLIWVACKAVISSENENNVPSCRGVRKPTSAGFPKGRKYALLFGETLEKEQKWQTKAVMDAEEGAGYKPDVPTTKKKKK